MLTILELIEILQALNIPDDQINSLDLPKIALEINKELYPLTIKLFKTKPPPKPCQIAQGIIFLSLFSLIPLALPI